MKDLTYIREFPVGTSKPCKIDTISFEDATVEETVLYFKERIKEFKGALAAANIRVLDEGKLAAAERKNISLREELRDRNTIIEYLEGKLSDY